MKLETVFGSIASKLKIDFEQFSAEITHRGSKGTVRERMIVDELLTHYMPANVGIGQGEIISTDGQVSPQTDIIFYEPRSCPKFINHESCQVFPAESVYGFMEVKSYLTTTELEATFEKTRRIKQMPRTAYYEENGVIEHYATVYGRRWDVAPVIGMIFAYDSVDLMLLRDRLEELQRDVPLHQRIDSVWVLKRGAVVSWEDKTQQISPTPEPDTRLRPMQSDNPLLLMTIHLQGMLQHRWLPRLRILDYLADVQFGVWLDSLRQAQGAKTTDTPLSSRTHS